VDARGRIAFRGNYRMRATGFDRSGIFLLDDGVVRALALEQEPAPLEGTAYSHFELGLTSVNDRGEVAFAAQIRDAATRDRLHGLFVASPEGGVELRALSRTPAPGTGSLFGPFYAPVGIDPSGRRLSALASLGYLEYGLFTFTRNAPPVAEAGPDQRLECRSPEGARATLDGSGSDDPDGDPLSYSWEGPFGSASGPRVRVALPLGHSDVVLRVRDAFGGEAADTLSLQVVDSTPPAAMASLAPAASAAARGAFEVRYACRDVCDGAPLASASFAGRPVENGELVRMHGRRGPPELRVRCRDAAGNAATRVALPGARGEAAHPDPPGRGRGSTR
jgi:hypothetical protein